MPTKATVDVKEPKDVKRLAAAEGVATKNDGAPVEMAQTAGPKDLDKLPFFQMLASMTERQWEDRIVYLYRQDKTIIKADEKSSNYIERVPHAFDESYVKEKHGGGRFLAILKNVRINGAERKHSFSIEGNAIIHDDEVSIKKTGSDAGGQKSELALVLDQVNRLQEKLMELAQKNNGAESATISNAVSMLSEASKGAMQIQQEAMKQQINSTTGHPLVDKFLEASIAQLGAGDKGGSELEKLVAMLKIIRELQPAAAGGGLLGNIGEIKGVLEVLKDLGVKIGGGGEAALDGAGGMDWKAVLASTLPQALQVIGGYAERFMAINAEQTRILRDLENARRAAQGLPPQPQLPPGPAVQQQPAAQTSAPAPANPPAASPLPANFAAAGAAPPEVLQPAAEEKVIQFPSSGVDMDAVARLIRRCFDAGDHGDAAALVIKRIFADDLAPYASYFSDAAQLKQLAGMSPLLKDIVDDLDFPEFLEEFVEEMNRNEDEPNGPEQGSEDAG